MRGIQSALCTLTALFLGAQAGFSAPANAPAAGGATPAPARNAPTLRNPKEQGPVQIAIKEILDEYNKIMKEKKGEGLREKCDYFSKGKPDGITAESVLAALEKPIQGALPRAESYVKWQLLSGFEGKFPDALQSRANKAYRSAPQLTMHPGMEKQKMQRLLTGQIGISNKDAEAEVNKEYVEAINRYRHEVEPMLEYRDEFYSRLNPGVESFQSGLLDLYARVSTGAPSTEFYNSLSGAIRSWATTASDARALSQMAEAVHQIYTYAKEPRNQPIYRVMWVENNDFKGLKWQEQGTIQQLKTLEEFSDWLVEKSKNPGGGGLGFKDEKGKK